SHAGRIGSGVGFNAFTVRSSGATGVASGAKGTKLGRRYSLSATQEHGSMEGRPIVRESPLTELRSKPPALSEPVAGAADGRRVEGAEAHAENAAPAERESGKPSK